MNPGLILWTFGIGMLAYGGWYIWKCVCIFLAMIRRERARKTEEDALLARAGAEHDPRYMHKLDL